MKNKIGIFTCNSYSKIHPRIQMQLDVMKAKGYDVELIKSPWNKEGFFFELLNLFYFKYFKWRSIFYFLKKVQGYDIIHVYDFQLLPLAKRAHKKGKKVIYETLDDNVHLHFYAMQKRMPFVRFLKSVIISYFSRYEKNTAQKYCNEVIVNSPNLVHNFNRASLIYYASNLETIKVEPFNKNKETVLLYLGKLTKEKGAEIYKSLLGKYNLRLIFLGKAMDSISEDLISDEKVKHYGEFNSDQLKTELKKIISEFNVIGLSIVLPINKSYELQEANKDIDYLSMSMPFIGNERAPTLAKIKAGAGVLYTSNEEIVQLIQNKHSKYDTCSEKAKGVYLEYSLDKFTTKLLSIYKRTQTGS